MCKAVEDWAEELLTEGEAKGRAEGKEEGIITTLADLVKNGIITVIQAAEQAKMPVEEFTKKAGETVFSQLSQQLKAERVLAKTFRGLCTRLVNKVLAYDLSLLINKLFYSQQPLACIKHLVF